MLADILKAVRGAMSSGFENVSPKKASEMLTDSSITLIDVRSTGEYASGHIAKSKNIPLDQLGSKLNTLAHLKDKTILINCLSGGRSSSACRMLSDAGFTKVYNVSGGISAWRSEGLPIKK